MDIPELGKQAAHVLIDAVSAGHDGLGSSTIAFQRLAEIGAFSVSIDDEGDEEEATVELTPVLGAAMVTIDWLVERLASETGASRDSVIFELREAIDE